MMFMNKALRVFDAKFGIGLEEGESKNTSLREGEIFLDFGHTYISVADVDTLRPDSWVGSMVSIVYILP
ncbi:hypothetical protein GQ457_01G017140 [Hibiscus cannabinus]